jgi:hypothetical protein
VTPSTVLDDLAHACAATADLLDTIAADQWTAPTPCTEWDVRGVVSVLPSELAERAFGFVSAELPDQSRTGRFGDPQPISDEASALDRLAAFTGRPVPWTP